MSYNKVDLIGQKFGRLLVLSSAKSRHSRAYWVCVCDCGTVCMAMGKDLRRHKKQSCGCLRREANQLKAARMQESRLLPDGEAAFNLLFASYRCSSEKRNIAFNITKEKFRELTQGCCFYCGMSPSQPYKTAFDRENLRDGYTYSGVDRKNNSLGYTDENSVSCCKLCNWMKNKFDVEIFLRHCNRVTEYQKGQYQ
ncbi:Uncharacterised protein [uncultured archaeon]|nr:Uncharacterised protein [uncultured archaeon]